MFIFSNNKWSDNYLDYYQSINESCVQVVALKNLEQLYGLYHTRKKSIKLLINYFPVVGFKGMILKVWSRLKEQKRNEKYISCGVGIIISAHKGSKFQAGELVGFVATFHPAVVERVVLPDWLMVKIDQKYFSDHTENIIYYLKKNNSRSVTWWQELNGWSSYSGDIIDQKIIKNIQINLKKELKKIRWKNADKLLIDKPTTIKTDTSNLPNQVTPIKKRAVLFGYGNYAKTNILPFVSRYIDFISIHEIDPTQINYDQKNTKWQSSPFPSNNDKYDVYFVASYNHTHFRIASHALKEKSYIVIEKPIVMDFDELKKLNKLLLKSGRKMFVGFHKRYGELNRLALEDLEVKYGDPISYHSIVYELKQPKLFWYNWKVSRSTFFANGCHQIDHFLYLNNFSKPKNYNIYLLEDGSVLVWVVLENKAVLTTVFSEKGTYRVGPRDIVELKVPGKNIRIIDSIHYQSENNYKIIRKQRINKTDSYQKMYQTIGYKISQNQQGDSIESIIISARLMLELEEKLQKIKKTEKNYYRAKREFEKYFH